MFRLPHRRISVAVAASLLAIGGLLVSPLAAAAFTSFAAPFTGATDFVTNFPNCGVGPVGMVFDSTHFFADDYCVGTAYRFPASGGSALTPQASAPDGLTGGLAIQGGVYYGINQFAGLNRFDPVTLAATPIPLFPPIPVFVRGVVADPLSGDLYISSSGGIFQVQNPGSAAPTVSTFSTLGDNDGIAFTSDGQRLYATDVSTQSIHGFSRSGSLVFNVSVAFHGPDGVAVALSGANVNGVNVSNNLFVNSNDGTIERIDTNNGNAVTVVASGGSRGDFVTVGPDGCLYVTQSDRVQKLTPCFFQTTTPPPTDAAITASGTPVNATEGSAFAGPVATFTDPATASTATDYSATIAWGDGSTSPGTITASGTGTSGNTFSVSGQNTYAEEGNYAVRVTITDVDTASNTATAHTTAVVTDAALAAAGVPTQASPTQFCGTTASFTDANAMGSLTDFTATIDWGDATGTSAGTVAGGPGLTPYSVFGCHDFSSLGFFTVTTHIVDDGGSTATATTTIVIFGGLTGGGSFVIGDRDVAVGTHVTFWGAQWWKANSLSGGAAPPSFKGFADDPSTTPVVCGGQWTTAPGNSADPPDSVPSFMAVIASSSVGRHGRTIAGDIPHLVIVRTDPGYAANPGHAGLGTVVFQVC